MNNGENGGGRMTITLSTDAIAFILTVVFLILKLCKVIAWPWVFVFLPLIISAGIFVITLIGILIYAVVKRIQESKYKGYW